jgi:hypothetical protein
MVCADIHLVTEQIITIKKTWGDVPDRCVREIIKNANDNLDVIKYIVSQFPGVVRTKFFCDKILLRFLIEYPNKIDCILSIIPPEKIDYEKLLLCYCLQTNWSSSSTQIFTQMFFKNLPSSAIVESIIESLQYEEKFNKKKLFDFLMNIIYSTFAIDWALSNKTFSYIVTICSNDIDYFRKIINDKYHCSSIVRDRLAAHVIDNTNDVAIIEYAIHIYPRIKHDFVYRTKLFRRFLSNYKILEYLLNNYCISNNALIKMYIHNILYIDSMSVDVLNRYIGNNYHSIVNELDINYIFQNYNGDRKILIRILKIAKNI